jgi:hypothetical protein
LAQLAVGIDPGPGHIEKRKLGEFLGCALRRDASSAHALEKT